MSDTEDVQIFCFSRKLKIVSVIATSCFFVLVAMSFYAGIFDTSIKTTGERLLLLSISLFFLICVLYSLFVFISLFDLIQVTQSDISLIHRNGKKATILWTDIAGIRNRQFLSRLELETSEPKKKIFIEHEITGYEELVDKIRGQTGDKYLSQLPELTYHEKLDQPRLKILKGSTYLIYTSLIIIGIGSILLILTSLSGKILGWLLIFSGIVFIINAINTKFSNRKPLVIEEESLELPTVADKRRNIFLQMLLFVVLLVIFFCGMFMILYSSQVSL